MLSSLDPEKAPEGPRVGVMAGGNAVLQRTGIGTDALAGRERAILKIIGIDGAHGRRMGKMTVSTAGLAISKRGGRLGDRGTERRQHPAQVQTSAAPLCVPTF